MNRLVEEQDWATRRIARLTDRCTHLAGLVPVADGVTSADDARPVDGGATSGEAAAGGLVAALAGDGGAHLAAAVQTAVGDLAALSVPDPAAGVELGCLADLPDRPSPTSPPRAGWRPGPNWPRPWPRRSWSLGGRTVPPTRRPAR
ncbi:MAG: hypothetical protein U0Q19_09715 [Kineosporiaceae bacterium]